MKAFKCHTIGQVVTVTVIPSVQMGNWSTEMLITYPLNLVRMAPEPLYLCYTVVLTTSNGPLRNKYIKAKKEKYQKFRSHSD